MGAGLRARACERAHAGAARPRVRGTERTSGGRATADLENHVDVVRNDVDEGKKGENEENHARREEQRAGLRIGLRAKRARRHHGGDGGREGVFFSRISAKETWITQEVTSLFRNWPTF